ncbi:O-antigen ligase [Desulfovibrio sp. JC022]|uniref:O-antigen ligase family protein n=1 Tax=Desulfovibrio sp. JC022 TaxID=2593642 RepID=UPI0013D267C5|nr:O-antigen ligase family protein [Desulfovibrio sp. JC022]NDV21847.1 O-antigen ligase family protein [Desulfovibrio sp. JC022]
MTTLLFMFFFFRPVMFVDIGWLVFGLNVTEVFAIFATGILIIAFILRAIAAKTVNISIVDFFLFSFVIWVLFIYLLYFDRSHIKDAAKFVLPFITYFVLKNVITSIKDYSRFIKFMLIGYAIPILGSTFLIVQGKGLYTVLFWNNLARFCGVYTNPHNLGHCMSLYLMLLVIYAVICAKYEDLVPLPKQRLFFVFSLMISIFALYCLYKSYVRTCFLGFICFVYYYLFRGNKKLLALLTGIMGVLLVLSAAVLYTIFFDMVDAAKGPDKSQFGSGRPTIWMHNIEEFAAQPLDGILAGVGVGNISTHIKSRKQVGDMWNSHNDFLDVLTQTGIIGFFLFVAFQFCLFQKIRLLEGKERYVFLALFLTVTFMNFVSNSYVTRFGLGQMFYAVLAYIELPEHKVRRQQKLEAVKDEADRIIEGRGRL